MPDQWLNHVWQGGELMQHVGEFYGKSVDINRFLHNIGHCVWRIIYSLNGNAYTHNSVLKTIDMWSKIAVLLSLATVLIKRVTSCNIKSLFIGLNNSMLQAKKKLFASSLFFIHINDIIVSTGTVYKKVSVKTLTIDCLYF